MLQLGPKLNNLLVDIDAGIDPATGIVHRTFSTIDPTTNEPPTDPLLGFLLPDDSAGDGEGRLNSLGERRSPPIPTGTIISNQAIITFDTQPPIKHQHRYEHPGCDLSHQHRGLAACDQSADFHRELVGTGRRRWFRPVRTSTSTYRLMAQPYAIWQQDTTQTSATFTGQAGHTYSFYSIAI